MFAFDLAEDGSAGPGRPVAHSSRSDSSAVLSPSGRRVAFVSERSGHAELWMHDFESGQSVALSHDPRSNPESPQWSRDERSVLYVERVRDVSRLLRVDIASGRVSAVSPANERVRFGSESPDGAWIQYSSDRSGTWQVWRMRPDGSAARQISHDGGLDPRGFTGDPHVYYGKPNVRGLFRLDPESGREEPVTELVGASNGDAYAVVGDEMWIYRKAEGGNARAEIVARPLHAGLAGDAQLRTVATVVFPGAFPAPALGSFDHARRRLITTMVTRDGTDVFVARLPD
jgi:Tol biopolymer transport system component